MTFSYTTKARIVKYTLPLLIIGICLSFGYHATRGIFAEAPAATGISITVDQPQYQVGQIVTITLSNATSTNVYVANNCPNAPLQVYKMEGTAWVPINAAAAQSKCAGEPQNYEIPADRSIKANYRYWPTLFAQPGRYRIVANIESFSAGPSADFTVIN
jgi:hypothetical protein